MGRRKKRKKKERHNAALALVPHKNKRRDNMIAGHKPPTQAKNFASVAHVSKKEAKRFGIWNGRDHRHRGREEYPCGGSHKREKKIKRKRKVKKGH
jgi:hypothetical protein